MKQAHLYYCANFNFLVYYMFVQQRYELCGCLFTMWKKLKSIVIFSKLKWPYSFSIKGKCPNCVLIFGSVSQHIQELWLVIVLYDSTVLSYCIVGIMEVFRIFCPKVSPKNQPHVSFITFWWYWLVIAKPFRLTRPDPFQTSCYNFF